MFLFKKKKIVVDCFTSEAGVYNYAPIIHAKEIKPSWWKNIASYYKIPLNNIKVEKATIKKCVSINEQLVSGFILPLWTDLIIEAHEDNYNMVSACEEFYATPHRFDQLNEEFLDLHHTKFRSPWVFKEKSGVNFSWQQPFYYQLNKLNRLHIMPGIVNYKYQHATEINIFFAKEKSRIELNHNDPLVHLIPLSDKEVEIKNHLVDEKEIKKLKDVSYRTKFHGMYRYNKDKQKKCPFHF